MPTGPPAPTSGGSGGGSGILLSVSAPALQVPATAGGFVSDFSLAVGQAFMFNGSTNVNAQTTFSIVTQNNCTAAITTGGAYSFSALSQNVGSIVIQGVYLSVMYVITVTISKQIPGTTGPVGDTGPKGNPGDTGPGGVSGLTLVLSNPSASVLAYASGNVPSFAGISGKATVLSGGTDVTASSVLSAVPSNLTGTVNSAINTPVNGQPMGYYQVTAMSSTIGTLTITAQYLGTNVTQVFNVTQVPTGYQIVSTLPSSGPALFEGNIVFLTTDGKLYRYHNGAWTTLVAATDVTGQLTAAQISSIAAAQITGFLTASQIASIASTQITGQLTNVQIASLDASQLTGFIQAPQIASIASSQISGQLVSSQIASVAFTQLTGSIAAAQIGADTITSKNLVISDFTNLVPNGDFASGTLQNWCRNNNATLIAGSSVGAPTVNALRLAFPGPGGEASLTGGDTSFDFDTGLIGGFPCAVGDSFYIQAAVSGAVGKSIEIELVTRTPAGVLAGGMTVAGLTFPDTSWHTIASDGTQVCAVAGRAYFRVGVFGGSPGDISYATAMICQRRSAGNLIVDGAITTTKIAAGAVTAGQIAAGSITTPLIAAGAVNTAQLAANAITAGTIAAGAITAAAIAAGTITSAQIAAGTIVAGNIAASTITGTQIAASTITSGNIVAGSILAGDIAANSLTAAQIQAGSITSNEIAANTIIGNNILAGTITAAKMGVTSLSSMTANLGAISAGTISALSGQAFIDMNNGFIELNNGVNMLVRGVGFGAASNYLDWFGPTQSSASNFAACTDALAIYFLKTDGTYKFGTSTQASATTAYTGPSTTTVTIPAGKQQMILELFPDSGLGGHGDGSLKGGGGGTGGYSKSVYSVSGNAGQTVVITLQQGNSTPTASTIASGTFSMTTMSGVGGNPGSVGAGASPGSGGPVTSGGNQINQPGNDGGSAVGNSRAGQPLIGIYGNGFPGGAGAISATTNNPGLPALAYVTFL